MSEIAPWSMEIDRDDSLDLQTTSPLPTDMNDVTDPNNAFSWTLSMADTEWQFGLDIPLTVEHTSASTGASSCALTDLDIYQLCNRPTQDFDTTGCSGGLVEYLSLSEKVITYAAFLARLPLH